MFVKEYSKERQAEQKRRRELVLGCTRFLSGAAPRPAHEEYREIADYMKATGAEPDVYGVGEFLNGFEEEIAALLGYPAAVFMPTGIMAQQIALRIWADRAANRKFGLHATSHLEVNEQLAYLHVHRLDRVLLGEKSVPYAAKDLGQPLASALLELPYRRLGGVLPSWEELEAIKSTAATKKMKLHLDGARLWESQPYYGKPLADLCRGFDSAYVSFYKGLHAIAGSMLLGPADFIKDARVWQRRHGGNVYTLHPYAVSSKINFDRFRNRFPEYWARARTLARALAGIAGITVRPSDPHTPMMHLLLAGTPDHLSERRNLIAREDKFWLGGLLDSDPPGSTLLEVAVGNATLARTDDEIVAVFRKLLGS
ncbi:MAG TPA: beta-eliminating lyase-related protein [Planctomycetota bacterium]|nr:beta-eliminating lyase-related protein [Planctomycetota bacterium]